LITTEFCRATDVPDGRHLLVKTRQTPRLKSVSDPKAREEALAGAFAASAKVNGKRVLILDDIYRSGATAREVARAIKGQSPCVVCLLTATRTRTRR
jgi:predicted amidophosphoribosyltransferase